MRQGRISGRMGGAVFGYDSDLQFDGYVVTGRVGGSVSGFDVNLTCGEDGSLTGRLGGPIIGKDCSLLVEGMPWLVAAALAAAVYYQMEQDSNNS